MDQNVGMTDRIIRIILAVVFIILALVYSYWWFIPAILALVTGMVGWCGLYTLFGWNTNNTGIKSTKQAKLVKKVAKKTK